MKKFIIYLFICSVLIFSKALANGNNISQDISGRWAEKLSERVVMDIYPDYNKTGNFQIFITWREDTLAQKDIYRFNAIKDKNGKLNYKNGTHIYRFYETKNKFEDKIDYKDGSGSFVINNNEIIWIDNKNKTENTEFIRANKSLTKDTTIKNKLFSITLPEELKGLYVTEIKKDKISVYHKESKEIGFGGFAFGIKAYKNPKDHAVLPGSKKLGELRDKKGRLYDIVLKHPTDVQYDYTKNSEPPEVFKILYNIGENINIEGIKGSTYFKHQGTKGEDLYKEVLRKHITAINEKWDSTKLEKENMSYMYNLITLTNKNPLEKIGYAYYDANADGIDELVIGEISDGNWKGVIYDMYTMVNREPKHVVSGGTRNRYYICDGTFVCNEYSSGAKESGVRVFALIENSTELFPQVSFKYDGYQNENNPWFISYGSNINEDSWENVTEKVFNERKTVFNRYERFNFIPLKDFK